MRERVKKALDEANGSWVIDGNYKRRIGSIVEDSCTDVICEWHATFLEPVHRPRILPS
jgi:hypothetical protein